MADGMVDGEAGIEAIATNDVLPETHIEHYSYESEPAFDDEVPMYSDIAEMAAHGLKWRPAPDEAPIFYRTTTNQAVRIITAENAYLIYDMMRDVIQRGTGRRARELGRPDLAGKTAHRTTAVMPGSAVSMAISSPPPGSVSIRIARSGPERKAAERLYPSGNILWQMRWRTRHRLLSQDRRGLSRRV